MAMENRNQSRLNAPPLELQRSRPRDVQLSAGGVFVTILAAALLAGSVVVTILLSRESASQIRERRLLDTTGVATRARVVRLWREANEGKTPRVEYAYDAAGREFDGRRRLPLKWWQSLQTGDSIDIRYLPADPGRHLVVHAEPIVLPPWLSIVAGALLAAGGLGCVGAVRRQRRLLSDGRIARATVTKIPKHHTPHGGSYRAVAFTFATLSGATIAGKSSTTRKGPDIGASIWVVYDPDNPKRSAVYPFQLVTLPRA